MEDNQRRPGNYLAIDGGTDWLSPLPALLTLEEMFERLKWDLKLHEAPQVRQVFDMIMATGYAVLAALMIGKLGLNPSQTVDAYLKLESVLSIGKANDDEERRRNSEAFRKAFRKVLVDAGFDEKTPMQPEEQEERDTKILACTLSATNLSVLYSLRSYPVRGSSAPRCTILDVACASIAFPDRFFPVTIGSGHRKLILVDAMAGYANPTKELLREAQRAYGEDAQVATIVSLGCGKGEILSVSGTSDEDALVNALRRMALDSERTHQELHERLNQTSLYFRFNVQRGLEQHRDVSLICERTAAYLKEIDIDGQVDEAVKSVKSRHKGSTLKDINSVTVIEVVLKPRPSVVKNFVGREDILDALRTTHLGSRLYDSRKPAVSVLMGLGGSGKTQIALKFALEYESRHPDRSVYFFDGSSEDTLKADFALAIWARGSAYRSHSHEDSLVWFANRMDDWLIIIDNADDPSVGLFHFIPKSSRGNVIITTRNATYKALSPTSSHYVEGLSPSDAVALILTGSSYANNEVNRMYAQAISKELGYLPLALAHATAYISIHQCLSTYLSMYRKSRAKFLDSKQVLPEDYSLSVATTVQMSLDSTTPGAREIMAILARCDASSIAHIIIATSAERGFHEISGQSKDETIDPQTTEHASILMDIFCPGGEWLESDFNDIVQQCMQYSLLQVTSQGEARFYSMHVLVQTYLQSNVESIQNHQSERLVVRLLGSAITIDYNYKYLAFNRLLASHLRVVALDDVVEAGDHDGFGQVLHEQGSIQLSTVHRKHCLEARRRAIGDEHPDTVTAMGSLAMSYSELGRYEDALDLNGKVLELQTVLSGDEHPSTVTAMANLAASYSKLGRYEEALDLQEKVLELRTRLLGDEHPSTVLAMGNLAASYSELGRYEDALDLKGKVLELRTRLLGDEHPDTVLAMGNLAASYSELGRYEDALDLKGKVLELQTGLSGDEHPSTVTAMANLAASYGELGRYQDALYLEEKVLELRKRILGDEHPDTVRAMANLAVSYGEVGRCQEALDLEEKVLELRTRISGDEHPDTVLAMGNLARSYSELGRYQEALDLEEKVLELRKRISGDEHPSTVLAMGNLAASYSKLGRYEEALDLQEKVLELRKRISGDEHPFTLLAMRTLAVMLENLEMQDRVISLLQVALPLHEKVRGVDHPDTLKVRRFLEDITESSDDEEFFSCEDTPVHYFNEDDVTQDTERAEGDI